MSALKTISRWIAGPALAGAMFVAAPQPLAPLHQHEGLVTQVRQGCGPGRVRIHGVCVTRGYGYYGYRPYGYYYAPRPVYYAPRPVYVRPVPPPYYYRPGVSFGVRIR